MSHAEPPTAARIAVAVAFLDGLIQVPLGSWASGLGPVGVVLTVVLVAVVAGVSAWLLHTWGAVLAVPLLCFIGYLLGAVVEAGVRSSLYSPNDAVQYVALAAGLFAAVYLLPFVLAAAFGALLALRTRTRSG
jgi:hypothetical protein